MIEMYKKRMHVIFVWISGLIGVNGGPETLTESVKASLISKVS